jgi:HSP20 family protein
MMDLVRWNPWPEMRRFRDRFNRLFNEVGFPVDWSEDSLTMSGWNPTVDVYESNGNIVLKAELPGVDKKDIKVDVKGRILTLKGERSTDKEVKEENFYRKESFSGTFQRAFTLPMEVDPQRIKAEYKDGVLKIEVPKPEDEKPKQITIN